MQRISPSGIRPEQDFPRAGPRSFGQGPESPAKRKFRRQKRPDVDPMAFEHIQSGFEPATAASDHADLVDDERRGVEAGRRMVGGLPDDRSARPHDLERSRYSPGGAGRFDNKIEGARPHAACAGQPRDIRARLFEDGRAKRSEFADSEHGGSRLPVDRDLVENLARRGERFRENRLFVGNLVRDRVEVCLRKSQVIRVSSRMMEYPEDAATGAVPAEPAPAPFTAAASQVDLADDSFPEPGGRRWADHPSDELMSRDAREVVVAASEFEVCVADARGDHPDQRESRLEAGPRHRPHAGSALLENEG